MFSESHDVLADGFAHEWLPVLKDRSRNSYALRVRSDSMTAPHGKSYPDGTIIIVDPELRSPKSGQRVIAEIACSGRLTFKVYIEEDDGRKWLKPLNPQHPQIDSEFKVVGTVIAKYEPE